MIRNLWPLLIGFSIWAVAFLAIYSLQALGCVLSWPAPLHRAILIAATLVILAALAMTLVVQMHRRNRKKSAIERAGMILTASTLPIAVVLFTPVAFLSLCT